jgi:hypothetical protein
MISQYGNPLVQGDERTAGSAVRGAFGKCSSHRQELRDILKWGLRWLGNQAPALESRCDAIAEQFLVSGVSLQ